MEKSLIYRKMSQIIDVVHIFDMFRILKTKLNFFKNIFKTQNVDAFESV